MVKKWGTGRPDYSTDVQRSVTPTILPTTTRPKPGKQEEYYATATVDVPAGSVATFVIGAGFTSSEAFVPTGKRFSLERVEVSGARNSLFKVVVNVSDGTTYTAIGQKYGYQNVTMEIGKFKIIGAGYRPAYQIYNYDTTTTITFTINVYGVVESVE